MSYQVKYALDDSLVSPTGTMQENSEPDLRTEAQVEVTPAIESPGKYRVFSFSFCAYNVYHYHTIR